MQAALKLATANDNLPFLPVPAEILPAETAENAIHPAVLRHSPLRDKLFSVLLIWTLMTGAVAGLFPGVLNFAALSTVLLSAGLTGLAVRTRREGWLTLASLAAIASGLLAVTAGMSLGAWLAWPMILGSLGMVQAGLAMHMRSDACAGLIASGVLAVIVGGAVLSNGLDGAMAYLPPLLAGALLVLGLARGLGKAKIFTSEAYYLVSWGVLVAGLMMLSHPATQVGASAEVMVVTACLGAGAAYIWARQGAWATTLALGVLAIGAVLVFPVIADFVAGLMGVEFGFGSAGLTQALVAGGIAAAGMALCFRGLRKGHVATMFAGALVTLVQALLVLTPDVWFEPEIVALFVGSAIIVSAWLISARMA